MATLACTTTMSDWEDEDDWESGGVQATNTFDDEEEEASSDEEDETLAELAREKRDAEDKLKANKPKMTFDEIMAERKTKDAKKQLEAQQREAAERTLTPEEQLQKMRDGLKAAELEDNRLMNELLGVETADDGKSIKEEEDPEALEQLTMAVSQLVLCKSDDYSALSQSLISQLRSSSSSSSSSSAEVTKTSHVGGFLETLLSEIITVQLADQLDSIGEAINAAKSTAEALEAAKPKVVVEETKPTAKKKDLGKKGDDKLYGMFEDVAAGDEVESAEEDSEEDSDEEEEVDFM